MDYFKEKNQEKVRQIKPGELKLDIEKERELVLKSQKEYEKHLKKIEEIKKKIKGRYYLMFFYKRDIHLMDDIRVINYLLQI